MTTKQVILQLAIPLILIILLFGCGKKENAVNELVFSGGDYRNIKLVTIMSDRSWVGITYEDDCAPSVVFYKTPSSDMFFKEYRDGRDYCIPPKKMNKSKG